VLSNGMGGLSGPAIRPIAVRMVYECAQQVRIPVVGMGGLSGPAIRPIAVRMVYECARLVKIPVIGIGGIASIGDALEFIVAGASAVQVGTANFVDPFIWGKLIDGLRDYMTRHDVARLADLVGSIQLGPRAGATS
jgi:dihydroorotate dehydrogenase